MTKLEELQKVIQEAVPEIMELKFGDYVCIEQKRHGAKNEMYNCRVVSVGGKSNTYVEVPVQSPASPNIHTDIVDIVGVITTPISEEKLMYYRIEDVVFHGRTITLADVLLASRKIIGKEFVISLDYNNDSIVLIMDRINTHPRAEWNLFQNDLALQDEATINYLHELLV